MTASVPAPDDPPGLVLTGERTLPGIPDERYWFERHVVAYRLAQARVAAGAHVVLDAGCGEGYGLAMLAAAGSGTDASGARPVRVIGVDLEPPVVAHARATYGRDGADGGPVVEVHEAELMSLPLADDEVDLVVSFQVIEHLHDIPGYLRSLRRVTRPGGEVWIATPNRLTFTPGSDTPVNPFHTREFTAAELVEECERAGFTVPRLHGIGHGRPLRTIERLTRRTFVDLVTSSPPEDWPRWLRAVVHRVDASWFTVTPGTVHADGTSDLDATLDLLAVCRVPTA
ncbi:MAG: class I SAM-dependent methyltransferase [Nitriliruptor sp.]|uniref:class I SAM-dependent methyltransferase n=1 Tax=Nitriliruptor sp. TaxID=2448056 RepID=UPI00349FDD96